MTQFLFLPLVGVITNHFHLFSQIPLYILSHFPYQVGSVGALHVVFVFGVHKIVEVGIALVHTGLLPVVGVITNHLM